MGEKVATKNEGGQKKAAAEAVEKAAGGGGGEKVEPPMTVVLKLDLHCEGCAKKVRRSVRVLEGVVTVKADCDAKKLTVTGNVDPTWLREKVEAKTKKKVDLVSPQPKAAAAAAGADKKAEEKKGEENKVDDNKKPKEVVISTVTMKTKLHCDGCAHKIKRIIIKNFDGVDSVTTNLEKDLITVIGTMDVNNLVTYLRDKLKRGVEIVPLKKDDGGGEKPPKETAAADAEEKPKLTIPDAAAGGGSDKKDGGGSAKQKEGDGGKKEAEPEPERGGAAADKTKVEVSKMEYHGSYNPQTHYAMPMLMTHNQSYGGHQDYGMVHQSYGHVAGPPLPPPTYLDTYTNDGAFSDENPNGCYIM